MNKVAAVNYFLLVVLGFSITLALVHDRADVSKEPTPVVSFLPEQPELMPEELLNPDDILEYEFQLVDPEIDAGTEASELVEPPTDLDGGSVELDESDSQVCQ